MKNFSHKHVCSSVSNAVYGIGMIGALIYFYQQANSFGEVVVGILKSIVWPAFLTYKLFEFLY